MTDIRCRVSSDRGHRFGVQRLRDVAAVGALDPEHLDRFIGSMKEVASQELATNSGDGTAMGAGYSRRRVSCRHLQVAADQFRNLRLNPHIREMPRSAKEQPAGSGTGATSGLSRYRTDTG